MKASKLAILLGLGASAISFASAKTVEQAYLDNCNKAPGVPVPVSVVAPHLTDQSYVGQKVEVEFTVTTTGKPEHVVVRSATDAYLADDVVAAVKQWQFAPATKNGVPVETKVILPVRVVPSSEYGFAAN